MRDGGESRTLPRRSDPHPPVGGLVLTREKSWGPLLSTFIIYVLLGHGPQTARAVVGGATAPGGGGRGGAPNMCITFVTGLKL